MSSVAGFWGRKAARQQQKIDKLVECLKYYADETNWDGYGECKFNEEDLEDYTQEVYPMNGEPELELIGTFGGKKARECLREILNEQD